MKKPPEKMAANQDKNLREPLFYVNDQPSHHIITSQWTC